jgi:hypothetical protein
MAKKNEVDHIIESNVLLYEKHDVEVNEVVKQGENRVYMAKGAKVFRVIRPKKVYIDKEKKHFIWSYRTLAQYDNNTDSIDLSKLNNYKGWFMASLDIDAYNQEDFVWNCIQIGEGTEDNKIFQAINARQCSDEEVEVLNTIFPEYYNNAFKGKN